MQSAVLAVIHERDLIADFQSFLIRESGIQEFLLVDRKTMETSELTSPVTQLKLGLKLKVAMVEMFR